MIRRLFLKLFKIIVGRDNYHVQLVKDELNIKKKIPNINLVVNPIRRIQLILNGFNSDKYIIYQLSVNNQNEYLNDSRRLNYCERISWKYYYIAHNKVVFNNYIRDYCKTVAIQGLIYNRKIIQVSKDGHISSLSSLVENLQSGKVYFLKPLDGGSGRNIVRMKTHDNKSYDWNKELLCEDELLNRLSLLSGYIIEEQFEQVGLSKTIYPETLNTMRIMTMIDPDENRAFIPVALHRFGTNKSVIVDNWSQGGLSVWIDVETGIMGKGACYPHNGKIVWYDVHPDSGVPIAGRQIPNWHIIKETILKLANTIPFMPLLGWDVILSGNEIYILEVNYNPDVNLIQIHEPLLSLPLVRKFYKYHKVIN